MIQDKSKDNREIKKPSAIIIIIMVALVVGLSFAYITESVNERIIESNIESIEELSLHDLNCIRNLIVLRWENMEGVASDISNLQYENADDLLMTLKAKTADIPSATKISLLDSEGTNYMSNGVVEHDSYLAEVCANKTEKFVIRLNTDANFRENTHEVLFGAVPVDFSIDDDHFEWMIAQFPIDTLEKELKIDSYSGEGYSSVIDSEGNYIINVLKNHSFMSYDNFYNEMENARLRGLDNVCELCDDEKSVSARYELNGQKYIIVVTPFDVADWHFVSTVPISVFDAQTRSLTGSFMILLLILAIVSIGVLILFIRQRRQQTELKIAEAASKSKTEFLFNMSHDIRTPMNAILGYTDIAIKHRGDQERIDDSLEKIKVAGSHLLNLINDILEMSRIESGKLEIAEEPMNLIELIKGVEQMSSSLAIDKSIEFKSEIGNIRNPYVFSDCLHANEVLINLISNAIKYTHEGGKVTLTGEQISDAMGGKASYRFEVIDNGIGMSEEFQEHLFEAFSREKSSTVSRQQGAGLGLSIVKKIVDLAGGSISVKSKLNEGSTFTVELPLSVMSDEEIANYEAENNFQDIVGSEFSFENKKVLLVEDNEMNREIAAEILEDVGLEVDTAEDGDIAVKAVVEKGTEYYDFVLMDIQMPVMNGYEAAKQIRALPGGKQMIIIALSANAYEEDVQKSLEAGMNAHVAKPIDIKILLETMQGLAE